MLNREILNFPPNPGKESSNISGGGFEPLAHVGFGQVFKSAGDLFKDAGNVTRQKHL